MSNAEVDLAVIDIMGREFKIKCPPDKISDLKKAASYLNSKMQEIQRGDKFITIDRIAITAALNIAHELMLEKQHLETHSSDHNILNKRLHALQQKLSEALVSTA